MSDVVTKYGLTQEDVDKIHHVFQKHRAIEKVVLYGSRAKGNFRPGSDIDFTIIAPNMGLSDLHQLAWELDDLLLPYQIDLSLFHQIEDPDLLAHIERVGVGFFEQ